MHNGSRAGRHFDLQQLFQAFVMRFTCYVIDDSVYLGPFEILFAHTTSDVTCFVVQNSCGLECIANIIDTIINLVFQELGLALEYCPPIELVSLFGNMLSANLATLVLEAAFC